LVGCDGPTVLTVLVPPGELEPGAMLQLEAEERRHLEVRRPAPDEVVRVTDGAGLLAHAAVKGGGVLELGEITKVPRPRELVLAVGAGDKERFAWLAEKCAELGVTRLVPLETDRSRNVASRIRTGHQARLQKRAREAIKQSGAVWAPEVTAPVELGQWLPEPHPGVRLLADHDGHAVPRLEPDQPLTVVIGPEGGFTEAETDAIIAEGFRTMRLGPLTLRFETAAVVAAALAGQTHESAGGGSHRPSS